MGAPARAVSFLPCLPAVLAAAVALAQIGLHPGSSLSPWKGGGYGMYTAPHPFNDRVIWLEASPGPSLRIAPADDSFVELLREQTPELRAEGAAFLAAAHRARPFPDRLRMRALLEGYAALYADLRAAGAPLAGLPAPGPGLEGHAAELRYELRPQRYRLERLP